MQRLKEDIRLKIIEMGKKRFGKVGYEKTSMKEIASDVGISTGNIYRYFLTKGNLLDEILKELESQIEDYFQKLPSNYDKINFRKDFDDLVELTVSIAQKDRDVLKIMFNSPEEKQFVAFKNHILGLFIDKMKNIASSVQKGKIDDVLCESVARSLFEGFTYITRENMDDDVKLRDSLKQYGKFMLTDIKERM